MNMITLSEDIDRAKIWGYQYFRGLRRKRKFIRLRKRDMRKIKRDYHRRHRRRVIRRRKWSLGGYTAQRSTEIKKEKGRVSTQSGGHWWPPREHFKGSNKSRG